MAIVITKRALEEVLKKQDMELYGANAVVADLLTFIKSLTASESYNYEEDFKDSLASLISLKYHDIVEVETVSLTDDDHSKWRIDIVLRCQKEYIPIELKYRHNYQSINGYAKDFVEDVHRINELVNEYDDIPYGFAICLTNIKDLVEDCNKEIKEYDASEEAKLYENNRIQWEDATKDYKIGIVKRYETAHRRNFPNNNSFKEYWDKKVKK